MTEEQRRTLTRQEAASVASTGIWFEMILQQMVLRDMYAKDADAARRSSGRSPRSPTSAGTRSCSPAARRSWGPRTTCRRGPPSSSDGGFKTRRLRRGGVRRDPGGRGGPRRHAARLDARRAASCTFVRDDQQHPRRRGVAAHEVRPARRPASDLVTVSDRRRRHLNALRRRDRRATSSCASMVNPAVYAERRPRRGACQARGRSVNEHHQTMMRTSCARPDGLPLRGRPAHPGRRADLPPPAPDLSG